MKRKSRKRPQIPLHSLLGGNVFHQERLILVQQGRVSSGASVPVWGGMGGLHSWEKGAWSSDAHALEREPNG